MIKKILFYPLTNILKYVRERMDWNARKSQMVQCRKGFGFIDRGEGKDIFVHYSQIVQNGYKTLNEGEIVEFELYQSERGMQAKHVVKI